MQQLNNWQLFYNKSPQQVFELADTNAAPDFEITEPGYWNSLLKEAGFSKSNGKDYGCYRTVISGLDPSKKYAILQKDSPKTSCAVYVNRQLVVQVGDPFEIIKDYQDGSSHSVIQPVCAEFFPDSSGSIEIIYFISNYFYRKSGLNDTVFFGPAESFDNNSYIILYSIICGALFFIGLLSLFQYFINRLRKEYLYLGITSISLALRISTNGLCLLSIIIPGLPAEIKFKLEYLAMWVVPVCVTQMLYSIYPSNRFRRLRYSMLGADFLLGWVSICLPAYYSNRLVPILQTAMGAICVYVAIFITVNLILKKRYAIFNFLSYLIVIIGAILDIFVTRGLKTVPVSIMPFVLVAFAIIQILMFAKIQNDIYKETTDTTEKLKELNEAYLRFVPREFIELLNKESIVKTQAGDYSEIQMSILFSKVLIECEEEEESLDEHFLVFTEYLKMIMPVVKAHNGFVTKILSGGFMALFPYDELDAVNAAYEIEQKAKEITGEHKIIPRSGIHYGKMIIGTVGEENRLDDTVISDTVNTAARIESVCEKLNKSIIISQEFTQRLIGKTTEEGIKLGKLQEVYVKGKQKPLQLYEVLKK